MKKKITYPVVLKRLEDEVSYRAILLDFDNQELTLSGNPFEESRNWIKKHLKQTNVLPFPSQTCEKRNISEEEFLILVNL